jgi:hypothetical protein
MTNQFELSDEQLAEVTGAGNITISPQIAVNTNVQTVVGVAPSFATAVSVGGNATAALKGAQLKLNNGSLLGNINSIK